MSTSESLVPLPRQRDNKPQLRIITSSAAMTPNLPELLARDLEASNALFALQNMTAGRPSVPLATEVEISTTAARPPVSPTRRHNPSFPRAIVPGLSSSLSAIQETSISNTDKPTLFRLGHAHDPYVRPSMDSEPALAEEEEDAVSFDSAPCCSVLSSEEVEPPSVRFREQSVVTAATSLMSAHRSVLSPSHKTSGLKGQCLDQNWANLSPSEDLDDDSSPATSPTVPFSHEQRLSGRHVGRITPLGMRQDATAESQSPLPSPRSNPKRVTKSASGSRISIMQEPDVAVRADHRSKNGPLCVEDICVAKSTLLTKVSSSFAGLVRSPSFANRYQYPAEDDLLAAQALSFPRGGAQRQPVGDMKQRVAIRILTPNEDDHGFDDDGFVHDDLNDDNINLGSPLFPPPRPRECSKPVGRRAAVAHGSQHGVRPITPRVDVETWLDAAIPRVIPRASDEFLLRGPPLPPEVLETLKVSASCFPETVLLTASLSIETIRNYGRKMKHPPFDLALPYSPPCLGLRDPPRAPRPSKKWAWSRVFTKPSLSLPPTLPLPPPPPGGHPKQQFSEDPAPYLAPASRSSPQPPWASLRNVFGPHVSDYLLDALYAHLVAYNYISAFCTTSDRSNAPNVLAPLSDDSQSIPHKAAALLGLSNPRFTPAPNPPLPSPPQLRNEGSFRALRAALALCVGKLVSTLRMASENGYDVNDGVMRDESCERQIDPFFVRSLCEIVRCCEDTRV